MSTTEKQRQQQAELQKKLWSIANDLRGNMDASEFRNYILGLIFYRFYQKTEEEVAELLKEDNISYAEAWEDEEYREALQQELINLIGFVIEPQDLFSHLIQKLKLEHLKLKICIKRLIKSKNQHVVKTVKKTLIIYSLIWI